MSSTPTEGQTPEAGDPKERERQEELSRQFQARLDAAGISIEDYAAIENLRRAEDPDENEVFRTSQAMERQIVDTLKLQEELGKDALTGLKNRRFYEEKMHRLQEHARAWRESGHKRKADAGKEFLREPFSLISFDIDHFKYINDTYGHKAGDGVLKELARRISKRIRNDDTLARVGGEEFYIIALAANGEAPMLAEKVRGWIEEEDFEVHDTAGKSYRIKVTVSVGVAPYDAESSVMENNSDAALYAAKGKGRSVDEPSRNQVWVWKDGKAVRYKPPAKE